LRLHSNTDSSSSYGRRGVILFVRIWLVALAFVVFTGCSLINVRMWKITILMTAAVENATVLSISSLEDKWDGRVYRHVLVRLPYSRTASLELEEHEPKLSEGEVIPVRAYRDSARYDTMTELYEVPRIAVTTVLLVFLVGPTLWAVRRYRELLRPSDATWFEQFVWVNAAGVFLVLCAACYRLYLMA
jgi:hypothetical protein